MKGLNAIWRLIALLIAMLNLGLSYADPADAVVYMLRAIFFAILYMRWTIESGEKEEES